MPDRHVGEADQDPLHGLDIRPGAPAEARQELVTADFVDHPVGFVPVYGSQAEDDVPEDLDKDAAQPEHDQGAGGIALHSDDDFLSPAGHFLDQDAADVRFRVEGLCALDDASVRIRRLFPAPDPQDDAARVGFVDDFIRHDLHDDGESHLRSDVRSV